MIWSLELLKILKTQKVNHFQILGVALCRCGASNDKPFCDGTHEIIGFLSKNKETLDGNSIIKDKRQNLCR
jgi:CDGSH-type Zn-finger protein